ncbi:MAG: hypothetical protein LBN06_10640, partial [Prevotellaceae bacterium]|nr:hypothetical protein [Prevotellaceae bacterium]
MVKKNPGIRREIMQATLSLARRKRNPRKDLDYNLKFRKYLSRYNRLSCGRKRIVLRRKKNCPAAETFLSCAGKKDFPL